MNLRQAAQQALEALECLYNDTEIMVTLNQHRVMKGAITALRAALAEPEQEPVAWMIWLHGEAGLFEHKQFAELEFDRRNTEYPDPDRELIPLYTAPTPRKPLTYEELEPLCDAVDSYDITNYDLVQFARAIERAHGIGDNK